MKKIRSKFLTFLLCASLLVPSIPAQAKLNIIDEHNAVDLETGIQHVNYPSMTTYLAERNKILSGMDASWSKERKLLYIHDYIVLNTEYDAKLGYSSDPNDRSRRTPSAQAYGVVVNHLAFCQGYADAFMDLATHVGVPTIRVGNKSHTWNAVELNGKWYYVDCTYDDPVNMPKNYCSHANFLKSEAAMRQTGHGGTHYHTKLFGTNTDFYYYPNLSINGKCTSTTYDNMNWNNVTTSFVSLSNGSVAYYCLSDKCIYLYKCDGSEPEKLVDMNSVIGQYTNASLSATDYITGDDSKIVFHASGNEWVYSMSKKTVTLKSGSAKKIGKGTKFTSGKITYKITGSATVSVYSIKKTVKTVEIPDEIEYYGKKYKVTAIGKNAAKNGKLKDVMFGRNVKSIGANAFYGCPLKYVTLGSTKKSVLTTIGKNAFKVTGKPIAFINNKLKKKQKLAYQDMIRKAGFPKKGTFGGLTN